MDEIEKDLQMFTRERKVLANKIHRYLAHSYSFFFIFLLIGVTLDLFFPLKIFSHASFMSIGFGLLIFATLLIIWAQYTSRNLTGGHLHKDAFRKGPYAISRNPTHWGLFLLMIGFGVIANAFFVIVTTVLSSLISKFIFLKKEEEALTQKYGQPYLEYKKQVKL